MIVELKSKVESGTLLDFSENIFVRKTETQLLLSNIDYVEKNLHRLMNLSKNNCNSQQTGGSANEMIQRGAMPIKKIKEQQEQNIQSLERIEQVDFSSKDMNQCESIMLKLAQIQKDCYEGNRIIFEELMMLHKVEIIGGGFGWRAEVAKLFSEKHKQIQNIKQNLNKQKECLDVQENLASNLLGGNAIISSAEGNEFKEPIEILQGRSQQLRNKFNSFYDNLIDTEISLDSWQSNTQLSFLTILEGLDKDEQDSSVQELVKINRQIAKIDFYSEKLGLQIDRNWRLLKRIELKLINKHAQLQRQQINQQLASTKQIAQKVEQKINNIKQAVNQQNIGKQLSAQPSEFQDNQQQYLYKEKSKALSNIQEQLAQCENNIKVSDEQLNTINETIQNTLQNSIVAYSKLFQDKENVDQILDKLQNLDAKYSKTMQQVKELNGELHHIHVFLQKQAKLTGTTDIMQGRQGSTNLDMSVMTSQGRNESDRLQLNQTLGEDELEINLIQANAAMMDEIDQAIVKCLQEQSCFKKLNIIKIRKGVYRIEKKEYSFKIMPGNNLAIRMFAGYIFTDCLVHFDEEFLLLVKG